MAGITAGDVDHQVDDVPQDLVRVKAAAYGLADLMQDLQLVTRKIQRFANALD
jgi:hypothetical protein